MMRLVLLISAPPPLARVRWSDVAFQYPANLALITLSGTVVDPRPFRDWRTGLNADGERRQ
jgi:RNA-directed DNA polymerase